MITQLTGKAIAIRRPDVDIYASVLIHIAGISWVHFIDKDDNDVAQCLELSPGSWSILGFAKDLNEEQWKEILPENMGEFATATMRGHSLLKSKSLNGNLLILINNQ